MPTQQSLDPDDLLRDHGPDAIGDVLRQTRPLSDVLWQKEFQTDDFATPEKRAQLETRLYDLIQGIADRTVKHYYQQHIRQRLRTAFSGYRTDSTASNQRSRQGPQRSIGKFSGDDRRNQRFSGGFTGSKSGPYQPVRNAGPSESLINSRMIRSSRTDLPSRDVLIVKTLLNHPWLLDEYAEEVAALHLEADVLKRLRHGILTAYSGHNPLDKAALRHQLEKLGYCGLLTQIEHAITHNSDRDTEPEASREDVVFGWRHRLTLHRKSVELNHELASAEQAFAAEQSDENYLRLQDLKHQLWSAEDAEILADS